MRILNVVMMMYFLRVKLCGIIAMKIASLPWKMPIWIFSSAWVYLPAANFIFLFFMAFVMKFMTFEYFRHSSIQANRPI